MRRILPVLSAIFLFLAIVSIADATHTTQRSVSIQNSTGHNLSRPLTVTLPIDGLSLINSGLMNSTASNAMISPTDGGTQDTHSKNVDGLEWRHRVSEMGVNENLSTSLFLGTSNSFSSYFTGPITVPHNSTLNLSTTFSILSNVYIDNVRGEPAIFYTSDKTNSITDLLGVVDDGTNTFVFWRETSIVRYAPISRDRTIGTSVTLTGITTEQVEFVYNNGFVHAVKEHADYNRGTVSGTTITWAGWVDFSGGATCGTATTNHITANTANAVVISQGYVSGADCITRVGISTVANTFSAPTNYTLTTTVGYSGANNHGVRLGKFSASQLVAVGSTAGNHDFNGVATWTPISGGPSGSNFPRTLSTLYNDSNDVYVVAGSVIWFRAIGGTWDSETLTPTVTAAHLDYDDSDNYIRLSFTASSISYIMERNLSEISWAYPTSLGTSTEIMFDDRYGYSLTSDDLYAVILPDNDVEILSKSGAYRIYTNNGVLYCDITGSGVVSSVIPSNEFNVQCDHNGTTLSLRVSVPPAALTVIASSAVAATFTSTTNPIWVNRNGSGIKDLSITNNGSVVLDIPNYINNGIMDDLSASNNDASVWYRYQPLNVSSSVSSSVFTSTVPTPSASGSDITINTPVPIPGNINVVSTPTANFPFDPLVGWASSETGFPKGWIWSTIWMIFSLIVTASIFIRLESEFIGVIFFAVIMGLGYVISVITFWPLIICFIIMILLMIVKARVG